MTCADRADRFAGREWSGTSLKPASPAASTRSCSGEYRLVHQRRSRSVTRIADGLSGTPLSVASVTRVPIA